MDFVVVLDPPKHIPWSNLLEGIGESRPINVGSRHAVVDGERLTAAGRQCLLSFEPARKTRQTYSPSALLPAKRPRGDTFFIDGGYCTVEQLSSIDYRSHGTARRATLNPIASALITKMPAPEACMASSICPRLNRTSISNA